MDPVNPPRLHGDPIGSARFKSQCEDFRVDELLGFKPSGEGEHCLLWIEKRERNTNDVASDLAAKLGIRRRLVSHCGLKDKHALTRQWFSIHLPGQESPATEDLNIEGVRVLKVTRNLRKLQRGAHDGNRFIIRLRECNFSQEAAQHRWQELSDRGVPNYFGPQRFGRDGANVQQAIKMMSGELNVRDRPLRGILISAARSSLFNVCVAHRVLAENWDTVLQGEVFGFANNRSLVLPDNLHGDESQRVASGSLELTAPLWGLGELQSEGEVRAIESQAIANHSIVTTGLAQFNLQQERRVMRLRPARSQLTWESETQLVMEFDLPKGTYATAVLRELADLE